MAGPDVVDDNSAAAQIAAEQRDAEKSEKHLVHDGYHDEDHHDEGKAVAEANLEHLHEELPDFPTEEEIATLRRVSAHIPLRLFTIAFVELCERFSFYGATVVVRSGVTPIRWKMKWLTSRSVSH